MYFHAVRDYNENLGRPVASVPVHPTPVTKGNTRNISGLAGKQGSVVLRSHRGLVSVLSVRADTKGPAGGLLGHLTQQDLLCDRQHGARLATGVWSAHTFPLVT